MAADLGSVKMSEKWDLGQRMMVLSTGPALKPTYQDNPFSLGLKDKE